MILLAGSLDIDASPIKQQTGTRATRRRSAWWMLSALRRIAGPQLHGVPGIGRHRHTGDAVALCQLRQLRGSRHPGQPLKGSGSAQLARMTTDRASIHRMDPRIGDRHDLMSGPCA